jgi:cellulose synthase/poly-beta-1,6-N-acetylglucosamine synthase-like glycosyltransferase
MNINSEIILFFISIIIIFIYSLSLITVFIFSLSHACLLYYYQKNKNIELNLSLVDFPKVTIQLPIYNEYYVIKRLLKSISKIDYPRELLQIQILDDSNDKSTILIQELVKSYKEKNIHFEHITRNNREGFKAGALKNGLKDASGDFIAIFDADFLPSSNWLKKTIPYFTKSNIGVVQTRWGHLNRNYSVLTKVQAFALDIHFTLEQVGRNIQNNFINFNGTAGVWRKECIIQSGNWNGKTLTEDLDLSYRAQLQKWKIKYVENITTLAELPITIDAVKSQQYRWNKGGAENFQIHFTNIIKSKSINWRTKINGIIHLLSSTMFLNVFIIGFLSIPLMFVKNYFSYFDWFFDLNSFFIISTIIFFICYWKVHKKRFGGGLISFMVYIKEFIFFFTVASGFSFHNSIAVINGHLQRPSEFIRTPKFDIGKNKKNIHENVYKNHLIPIQFLFELFFVFYFFFGLCFSFYINKNGFFLLFPFHLILFSGFFYIIYNSLNSKN